MAEFSGDKFDLLVIGGGITGCGVARDAAMRGFDVTARAVSTREGLVYFAALGGGMSGVGAAVQAVQRIFVETYN